jgi:RNA polymerase sigma factor (TIGR02999 family)
MPGEMTRLLVEWKAGRRDAGDELVSLTFAELRRLARSYLRRERAGHTLQATALLNEVYRRLLPQGPQAADSRDAFFRLMAAEMRHRLVDHARRRLADQRVAGPVGQPLDTAKAAVAPPADTDVEATLDRLDRAVQALGDQYPRAARVVQLRLLAGLTTEETALEMEVSPGTIQREWVFARAWLAAAMTQPASRG